MAAPGIPNLLKMRGGPRPRRGGRGGKEGGSLMGPPLEEPSAVSNWDMLIRQTDTDASISRLSAVNIGYLTDQFAEDVLFNKNAPRRLPIINRGTYVRTTAIDRLVETFISSNIGSKKQIISLGAGTDTRYWRLCESNLQKELLYHEIDFPAVSKQKLTTIRASKCLSLWGSSSVLQGSAKYGNPELEPWGFYHDGPKQTEGYLFHPIDLRYLPTKMENLIPELPTLLISECCLCYLQPSEASAVFDFFTSQIDTLGVALYEPTKPNSDFGIVMTSNLLARGLQMPTVQAYPSLQSQIDRFQGAGFFSAQNGADVLWLWKNWVGQDEKDRIAQLEMMDEVEEWELLASHYTVMWAYREKGKTRGHFSEWKRACLGEFPYRLAEFREETVPSIEQSK